VPRGHAEDQLIGRGVSERERRDRLAEALAHSLVARVAADLLLEKLETPGELGHDGGEGEHSDPGEGGADDEDPLRQHGAALLLQPTGADSSRPPTGGT